MSKKRVNILIVIAIIILLIGIVLGVFIKNFPIIEFDKKVTILGSLTFLLTLAIGAIFPFLIKKWIDDNQTIKSYLVKEIEQLVKQISKNKKIISESYSEGTFTSEQRDSINFIFHSAELQIESIQKQFEVSFPNSLNIVEEMKVFFRDYKDYLTGGRLMISTFDKVDLTFYREHSNKYNKFESHLKEMIHKIHRI